MIIHDTLDEIGNGSLEVSIEYKYYPGEPMVMYYPDGSGYPGSPAGAELIDVYVIRWDVDGDERLRDVSWVWEVLDGIARESVEHDWKRFEELFLDAAN